MTGWLIYSREEAERNAWFIGQLIAAAQNCRLDLELKIEEELQPDDAQPDFALYRGRDFDISRGLEDAGVRVFNRTEVNRIANDKLAASQLAMMLGVPAIPTAKVRAVDEIRSFPAVVKTADGHGGSDVFLLEDEKSAAELFAERPTEQWIVQPFIDHTPSDVRLYMLGVVCIGAVKRTGAGSFKSNVALGGTAEPFSPPAALTAFAERIAKALKSDYVGIDFIQDQDGIWLFNELEDPVGARSLYAAGDLDVAEELMKYISDKLDDPFAG
ncbi:ATP-grasp domain-containing protein [Sporosarcina trichiuri]|uniref:ATP-grasp domain-containing protein n=1 Tax=Sporosarcina trichiuri TaxID=3056445 RepID=UPI0025B4A85C|nr:ATP-grasp domain-containing protein [Sporosarcina sp. 0.2-SM1T-5]WJY28161.1 ATP-grasp domain-containing protein [Sporosarcina sp. 0.2-SM1T-5]